MNLRQRILLGLVFWKLFHHNGLRIQTLVGIQEHQREQAAPYQDMFKDWSNDFCSLLDFFDIKTFCFASTLIISETTNEVFHNFAS